MKNRLIFSCLILFVLLACSKDDDPGTPEEPKGTLKGVFVDSPVSGLRYETETHSGYTDEKGNFDYEEGETVTFYVGNIKLGSALAAEEISPLSIASTPGADINTLEVQNIAALLQTLDLDGDPENGIEISSEVTNAIGSVELDFTSPIIEILSEIVIQVFQNTGISLNLVYPERAALHLATTLKLEFEPQDWHSFNFLPTFESYFSIDRHSDYIDGYSRKLLWEHDFNEEGKLIKSIAYEAFPFRILAEYSFSNYNASELSVDLQIVTNNYNSWKNYEVENYTLKYDQNFLITELIPGEGALTNSKIVFEEYDSQNNILVAKVYNSSDQLVSSLDRTYDTLGGVSRLEALNPDGTLHSLKEFVYTDFGEIETAILNRNESQYGYKYFYREDNSLEKIEDIVSEEESIYTFSQEENLTEWTISYANGYKVTYLYSPEEKVEMEYYNDVLDYIYYYRFEDGFGYSGYPYKWEWYEDGILRERYVLNENYKQESYEYFYDNGNVEYKDFYDADGNWIYTEYYDEEGNLLNTEYQ